MCEMAHVTWSRWTPEWASYLWNRGGHSSWAFTREAVRRIPGFLYNDEADFGNEKTCTKAWSRCYLPNFTKLNLGLLEDRQAIVTKVPIYGAEPAQLTSRSLMSVRTFWAVAFGSGESIIQGVLEDVGEVTHHADGTTSDKRCLIRSAAAGLAPKAMKADAKDTPHASLLEQQIFKDLASIPVEEMDPSSRASALYYTSAVSDKGLADGLWSIVNPELLRNHNLLHFTQYKGTATAYYYPVSSNDFPRGPLRANQIGGFTTLPPKAVRCWLS